MVTELRPCVSKRHRFLPGLAPYPVSVLGMLLDAVLYIQLLSEPQASLHTNKEKTDGSNTHTEVPDSMQALDKCLHYLIQDLRRDDATLLG